MQIYNMLKKLLPSMTIFVLCLMLQSCSTIVPVKMSWPKVPEELLKEPPMLKQVPSLEQLPKTTEPITKSESN